MFCYLRLKNSKFWEFISTKKSFVLIKSLFNNPLFQIYLNILDLNFLNLAALNTGRYTTEWLHLNADDVLNHFSLDTQAWTKYNVASNKSLMSWWFYFILFYLFIYFFVAMVHLVFIRNHCTAAISDKLRAKFESP